MAGFFKLLNPFYRSLFTSLVAVLLASCGGGGGSISNRGADGGDDGNGGGGGSGPVSMGYPPCPVDQNRIVVCGASEAANPVLTEVQGGRPSGKFKIYLSEPLTGTREQIIVALQAQETSPGSGVLTFPGTATQGQDYTLTVLTPGVTLRPNVTFGEYELILSRNLQEVEFQITTQDDTGVAGTSPAERNEDNDETVNLNIIYVAGISRSNDNKVRNTGIAPLINGSTFRITTGSPDSLFPLFSNPPVGTCLISTTGNTAIYKKSFNIGPHGCDGTLTFSSPSTPWPMFTAIDSMDRFYILSGSISPEGGRINRYSAYQRFAPPASTNHFALNSATGAGIGSIGQMSFAMDPDDRLWIFNFWRSSSSEVNWLELQSLATMPTGTTYNAGDMFCRINLGNPGPYHNVAFHPSPSGSLIYVSTRKSDESGHELRAYTMDSLLDSGGVCSQDGSGQGERVTFPGTPATRFSSNNDLTKNVGLTVDSRGRVYHTINHGFQIYARNSTNPSSLAKVFEINDQGSGDHQFDYPMAIALDSSDRIYVADSGNHRVRIFAACLADMSNCNGGNRPALLATIDGTKEFGKPDGAALTAAQQQYSASGGLRYPVGLSIDSADRIWVVSHHGYYFALLFAFFRTQVFAPYRP